MIPHRFWLRHPIITLRVRIDFAWRKRFKPLTLHPDELTGFDGEPPYFLRVDLASTREEVVAYWLNQWGQTADEVDYMEPVESIDLVYMLEGAEADQKYDEGPMYHVRPLDADAVDDEVLYWRWSE